MNETFENEVAICRKHKSKGGCNRGRCDDCGVIPLLYKLFLGKIVEDKSEIEQLKKGL